MWYLGGFVALLVCTLGEVGPAAWASAWQVRHWGSDNRVLSFLPGFAVLLTPLVVLACLERRPDRPFISGAKDALWPRTNLTAAALPPERIASRLRTGMRICLGMAIFAAAAAGVGTAWLLTPGAMPAGTPLPMLTLAATAATATVLPGYGRIADAIAQPQIWRHRQTLRTSWLEDAYLPLTGPDWRPGDPVRVLEHDHSGLVAQIDPPGPREGALTWGGLPGWQIQAMREAGLAVVDDPVVLTRRVLDGVAPGPDPVTAFVPLGLGGAFVLVFGLMAWSFWRARRRLLRQADFSAPATRPDRHPG